MLNFWNFSSSTNLNERLMSDGRTVIVSYTKWEEILEPKSRSYIVYKSFVGRSKFR